MSRRDPQYLARRSESSIGASLEERRSIEDAQRSGKATYAKRGRITLVACEPCRKYKIKCDGGRPICSSCQTKSRNCRYGFAGEERSTTFLRADRKQKEQEIIALSSIIDRLRHSEEPTATEIFHQLRQSHDVFELAQQLDAAHSLTTAASHMVAQPSTKYDSSEASRYTQESTVTTSQEPDAVRAIVGFPTEDRSKTGDPLKFGRDDDSRSTLSTPGALQQPLGRRYEDEPSAIEGGISSPEFESSGTLAQIYTSYTSPAISESYSKDHLWPVGDQWGKLVGDHEHTNELIALYFTWQHSLFECFPEGCFREDMRTRQGTYYSPLLVNAICATASLMSDQANAHGECLQYFNEALHFLKEVHVSSLATIAAFSLLSHVEESRGRMSSMWLICGRSSRMSLDMQLHLRQKTEPLSRDPYHLSRMHTFWGSLISDSIVSFTLARVPGIPVNAITVDMPEVNSEDDAWPWTYAGGDGGNGISKPSARTSTFNRLAALAKLINSTLYLFFAPVQRITDILIVQEHDKYLEWFNTLPAAVISVINAPPHVLCLHMQYHAAVLLLFRPLLSARFIEDTGKDPRKICKYAADAICEAFEEHTQLYHHFGICTFQVHCLLTACTIHIINLRNKANLRHLESACRSFHKLAPKIIWAAASLHIIKGLTEKWGIRMPLTLKDALYGPTGKLPNFEFNAGGEADSYLLYNTMAEAPSQNDRVSTYDYEGQRRENSLFSPFPNQQLPLLNPTLYNTNHTNADKEGQSIDHGYDTGGIEFLGDEWFNSIVANPDDIMEIQPT